MRKQEMTLSTFRNKVKEITDPTILSIMHLASFSGHSMVLQVQVASGMEPDVDAGAGRDLVGQPRVRRRPR